MAEQNTLAQRCLEVLEWKRTGLLADGELRKYAEKAPHAEEYQRLMWAESKTAEEAMKLASLGVSQPKLLSYADIETIVAQTKEQHPGSEKVAHYAADRAQRALLAAFAAQAPELTEPQIMEVWYSPGPWSNDEMDPVAFAHALFAAARKLRSVPGGVDLFGDGVLRPAGQLTDGPRSAEA